MNKYGLTNSELLQLICIIMYYLRYCCHFDVFAVNLKKMRRIASYVPCFYVLQYLEAKYLRSLYLLQILEAKYIRVHVRIPL